MGEHTECISLEILGMPDAEFAALAGENVFE